MFRSALLSLLFALPLSAAPPTCTLPPEITGEPVSFVEVKAQTTGKWVRYVTLDAGLAVFPSNLLTDKTVTVVVAAKPGRYRILAYAGNEDGGAEAITTLVIGGAAKPPDKPTDPVDHPKTGTPYLFVVRQDGPALPSFAKVMADPAWDAHRKAGILVRDVTFADSKAVYTAPAGTVIPFVVPLRIAADGKSFTVVKPPVPLTESTPIAKLAELFQ